MFSLKVLSPAYFAPAQLSSLDETGALQSYKFDLEFRRLTMPEIEAVRVEVDAGTLAHDALFDRVLIGWRGIADVDGVALPYCAESLAKVVKVRGMRQAISRAFFDSLAPTASAWFATDVQ